MFNKFLDEKELNVKPGDIVSIQGNEGIVLKVYRVNESTDVKVHFTGPISIYKQYQDKIYGGFKVIV